MKNKLIALMMAGAFIGTNANATGIPVFDAGTLMNDITQHVEDIAQFTQQVQQLQAQLQQAQQMFNSMNGARGMAALLNNPMARQYLPKSATDLYALGSNAANGKYSTISGAMNGIKTANQVLKSSDIKGQTGAALEKYQNSLAQMQATAEASFAATANRFDQLQTFVDQVDLAQDPKAAQDLQNRISAEQLMMQNELSKLAMMKQVQDIQNQQMQQQYQERAAKVGSGKPVYVSGYQ